MCPHSPESQPCPGLHQKGKGGDPAPLLCAVRAHLEHCVQRWSPQYRRNMDLLEHVQRRATEMIPGMEHLPTRTGWELGLFSLENRRLQGDLRVSFQYLKGGCKKGGDRFFSRVCGDRIRGNGFRFKEGRFMWDVKKKYFTVSVVKHWNRIPTVVVDVSSLDTFKARLDQALGNLI